MDQSNIIKNLLQQYQIRYWESGNNCSKDYINVCCPLCDDHSNHNGINRESLVFHCWKCGKDGSFAYLLSRLTSQSVKSCLQLIRDAGFEYDKDLLAQLNELFYDSESETHKVTSVVELPQYFESVTIQTNYPLLTSWMKRRQVDLSTVVDNGCGVCTVGKYMCRLVFPVYFEGQLVSFVAGDLTGQAEKKYVNAQNDINNFLYGWDKIDSTCSTLILVEGVLDQWRCGYNTLCTFGTSLTDKQRKLLIDSKVSNLVFCWDSDAVFVAREEAELMADFVDNVYVVELPKGEDPDSFGTENTWDLILKTMSRRKV